MQQLKFIFIFSMLSVGLISLVLWNQTKTIYKLSAQTTLSGLPTATPYKEYLPFTANEWDSLATPTATPPPTIVQIGELASLTLKADTLGSYEVHSWTVPVQIDNGGTAVLTATVFSADAADLTIAIADEQGNIRTEQNNTPAGEAEHLTGFPVTDQTTYYLYIATTNGRPASYALSMMYDTDITFNFQNTVTPSTPISSTLPQNTEHFWFYESTISETLTITANPDDTTDVFIELYSPEATRLSPAFVNAGANGITETYTHTLSATGMYLIRIGEWNFDAGTYQVTVTSSQE